MFVDPTGTARALDDDSPGPGFPDADGQDFPTSPPVAVWMPSQPPVAKDGIGYRLPASSDVVVRLHYKKTWITDGQEFADQTRVGLYFAEGSATEIQSLTVNSPENVAGREVRFTHEISEDVTLVALFPEVDIESSELQVEAVTPGGARIPMLWLREPDAGWPTRFWFDSPVNLPKGSTLEVTALLEPGAERSLKRSLLGAGVDAPIRFVADYVSGAIERN